MDSRENWNIISDRIQQRAINTDLLEFQDIKRSEMLRQKIQKDLIIAESAGVLKTKPQDIRLLLKCTNDKSGKGKMEITGGGRNFNREKDVPHFERTDGCWFDFAIFLDEGKKKDYITCIGFNFEIRFPSPISPHFLRFDLNPPNHHNDDQGLRFHVHPGNDDLMIHSPPMSPMEILTMFLYGLPLRYKPRAS